LFGFDGWVIAEYTDIEGQAQPLARLASASWQSIKTKQKCCTGARTELLYRFEFSCNKRYKPASRKRTKCTTTKDTETFAIEPPL